ncbi:hypothetical protein GUJ93_ZPchr0005g14594 [Zizania palustris]|uniref:Uncharacterized protein n=1 Tax=Zizania palustris TaxID=103762 RepID=A0A8J5T4M1_ZIZPA|nr:hypothetical protein GUJ93_ZPchr0005g14594 [Zizania palustris]
MPMPELLPDALQDEEDTAESAARVRKPILKSKPYNFNSKTLWCMLSLCISKPDTEGLTPPRLLGHITGCHANWVTPLVIVV